MTHPVNGLDDVVHQRARLGVLAILAEAGKADFAYIKGELALTDGNLGRHLQVLEESGLVRVSKTFEGRRPRTWVSMTPAGRRALAAELDAFRAILARVSPTGDS